MHTVIEDIVKGVSKGNIEKNTAIKLIKEIKSMNINDNKDIAIIGMSFQLPYSNSPKEFWSNIANGIDCIREFPESRSEDIKRYINYKKGEFKTDEFTKGAYLKHIDEFDYSFFRISPKEAKLMDPCQKLFLQEAWHAMEDAGYSAKELNGSNTGVFLGFANTLKDSYQKMIYDISSNEISASIVGNLPAIIPSRISYLLDFDGPSILIDTACSSSLVAIHTACKSLNNKECTMAIVGGVKLHTVPIDDEDMQTGVESATGRTRAFDDDSDGAGIGEGVAAMVLKPMKDAIKDKDNIYAVIKGSAINQDGNSINISAPNPVAQSKVIIKAWKDANVNPETIDYIQTHGTGTILGDPIEVRGIEMAFKEYTNKKQFCAIHSVKSNIGHLYECSGMANILTAILALNNKEIPRSIYFNVPNKKIIFEDTPIYVNTKRREWKESDHPRRCGVSSFGFSGTNCHLILEEAPLSKEKSQVTLMPNVLKISAKTENALKNYIINYTKFIEDSKEDLWDVCYTANIGRDDYNYRIIFIVDNKENLIKDLKYIAQNGFEEIVSNNIFYGKHKVIPSIKRALEDGEITQSEKNNISKKAMELINSYLEKENREDLLFDICRSYVQGGDIDWPLVYKNANNRKLSIPGYPFENKRCWLDIPISNEEKNDAYYELEWEESKETFNANKNKENILILKSKSDLNNDILKKIRENSKKVIEVSIGQDFEKIGNYEYTVALEEDYLKVADLIKEEEITRVIHASSLYYDDDIYDLASLEKNQKYGVESLFCLIKAIGESNIDRKISLIVISDYINEVTKSEIKIKPENATLLGLTEVICKEYPDINSKLIDIDLDTDLEKIISEIYTDDESVTAVAYRKNQRYIQCFNLVDENRLKDKEVLFNENGVYVITGGTGDIGLEFAKYLATKANVNVALLSRMGMPERSLWDDEKETNLNIKINKIKNIENLGSNVDIYGIDVSNELCMKKLFNELVEKYGKINGIIHAAGTTGDTLISDMDIDEFKSAFKTKVYGTWIIDKITENLDIDFMVLFSSIATIFSGPGQSNYVAANIYMDAYSKYRNKKGMRTLTVNWSTWKEIGMSVKYGVNVDTLFKAIKTDDAIRAFNHIFNKDISNVLIGYINENSKYTKQLRRSGFKISERIIQKLPVISKDEIILPKTIQGNTKEVKITGKDEITEVDKKLAKIWGEVLGVEKIDIYESFYELGGDSILGMSLLTKIKKEFKNILKISVAEIFTLSTFIEMSNYIDSKIDIRSEKRIENEKIDKVTLIDVNGVKIKIFSNGMLSSNTYIVYKNSTGIIIDAGAESSEIINFVKDNNLKIKYIVLTHAHIDHILSINELREELDASVLIHENEIELLNDNFGASIIDRKYMLTEKDSYLKDEDKIDIGEFMLEIILTPGHTQGSICIKIDKMLFTGDTLFKLAIGGPDYKYGDNDQIINSITGKLFNLNSDILVYPGHGEFTTLGYERVNNKFTPYMKNLQRLDIKSK